MKILFSLISCCLIMATSCKKSSTEDTPPIPPGNPDNEVKAMVSVKGSAASPLTAIGNSTIFAKRVDPNGDTVISITGSDNEGQVDIFLINISSAGTYAIENNPTTRQYVLCHYTIGTFTSGSWEMFIATTGNQPGTVTIDNITSATIKGSFTANCIGTGGIIQITEGSFKGDF